jgi:hypothetical protein
MAKIYTGCSNGCQSDPPILTTFRSLSVNGELNKLPSDPL